MALGTASALMLAGGVASATSSIMAGNAQAKNAQRQAEHNAQVYEQQAEMIKGKQKLQERRDLREAARYRGAIVAKTAGKGLGLSGSPLAILADTESELALDNAINQYNLEVEGSFAKSKASSTRIQGRMDARLARTKGYSSAFSTMLGVGSTVAMRSYRSPTTQYGSIGGKSITSNNTYYYRGK